MASHSFDAVLSALTSFTAISQPGDYFCVPLWNCAKIWLSWARNAEYDALRRQQNLIECSWVNTAGDLMAFRCHSAVAWWNAEAAARKSDLVFEKDIPYPDPCFSGMTGALSTELISKISSQSSSIEPARLLLLPYLFVRHKVRTLSELPECPKAYCGSISWAWFEWVGRIHSPLLSESAVIHRLQSVALSAATAVQSQGMTDGNRASIYQPASNTSNRFIPNRHSKNQQTRLHAIAMMNHWKAFDLPQCRGCRSIWTGWLHHAFITIAVYICKPWIDPMTFP